VNKYPATCEIELVEILPLNLMNGTVHFQCEGKKVHFFLILIYVQIVMLVSQSYIYFKHIYVPHSPISFPEIFIARKWSKGFQIRQQGKFANLFKAMLAKFLFICY
jgi:uncharacterized membrane protein